MGNWRASELIDWLAQASSNLCGTGLRVCPPLPPPHSPPLPAACFAPTCSRTCIMWFISMPVAAAQLVLLTAAEDFTLVGDEGFASALPLAASGPGEPFVTAAGVLGE